MMKFDGPDVLKEFQEEFMEYSPTPAEMWWLIKVIKHCRGRCRNNAALLNYLRRNFTALEFKQDEVTDKITVDYKSPNDGQLNEM